MVRAVANANAVKVGHPAFQAAVEGINALDMNAPWRTR